jgi:transcription initiation factor TFIID subunit 9B
MREGVLVINKFLEFWYRYVVDVLTDVQVYSDVNLAIQSQANFNFSQPPCREVLLELAQNCNKIPLPNSIAGPGFPLPPDLEVCFFFF